MATQGNQIRESMIAGANLTQWTFVSQNTTDRTVVTTGAGAAADGVVISGDAAADSSAVADSGNAATIVLQGRVIVEVGTGGLTAGDLVASDANGEAVTATTSDIILGKALEDAAAGTRTTIDFFRGGNAAA